MSISTAAAQPVKPVAITPKQRAPHRTPTLAQAEKDPIRGAEKARKSTSALVQPISPNMRTTGAAPKRPDTLRPHPAPTGAGTLPQAEDHLADAEKAIDFTSQLVETIMALHRRRVAAMRAQHSINSQLHHYLLHLAMAEPQYAALPRQKLYKIVQEFSASHEKALIQAASGKPAPRADHVANAEKALIIMSARETSQPGSGEEDHDSCVEKTIISASSSPPAWADLTFIECTYESRKTWDSIRAQLEKKMMALAQQLPVYTTFWASIKGAGPLGLATLVGEAGDIGSYKSKAHLWKRMGVAVIDGERQRKRAGKRETEEDLQKYAYNPSRRAVLYNICDPLLKRQGKGDTAGPYRKIYDRRRAYLDEREQQNPAQHTMASKKHKQNEAMRYMGKALLTHLRAAWRASQPQ